MLGMVEFSRQTFQVPDYFKGEEFEDYLLDASGQFIWPHAVGIINAWRFDHPKRINDVIGRNFSSAAIQTVDEISDEEQRLILAESHSLVPLAPMPARLAASRLAGTTTAPPLVAGAPGQPGPAPNEWSAEVSRTDGPTATYLARFGPHNAWKIGISQNPGARMKALNFAIPRSITGCGWELKLFARWENGAKAYEMEQTILGKLADLSPINEQFHCEEARVTSLWNAYIAGAIH
jgi:hypothetical protein